MSNNFLDTKIIIDQPEKPIQVGETRSGKIIFTPQVDIFVLELGYDLLHNISETDMPLLSKKIEYQVLLKNTLLSRFKKYTFDITIDGKEPITYIGKNFQSRWIIKTFVNLRTPDYLKIRNDLIKQGKISTSSTSADLLYHSFPLNFSDPYIPVINNMKYKSMQEDFGFGMYFFGFLALLTTILFLVINIQEKVKYGLLTFAVLIFLFMTYLIFKSTILRSIKVKSKVTNENKLHFELSKPRNWSFIKKINASYSIKEEHIIKELRRNYSSAYERENIGYGYRHLTSTIYKSPSITEIGFEAKTNDILDFPEVHYDFEFDFPKKLIPDSGEFPNTRFIWTLHLNVFFNLGFQMRYYSTIDMAREMPLNLESLQKESIKANQSKNENE